MISAKGEILLGDLGNCISSRNGYYPTEFIGTPCWMAPEVIEQKDGYDQRADMWSLGITALELAEGLPPWHSEPELKVVRNILNEKAPSISSYDRRWSVEFRNFVNHCL